MTALWLEDCEPGRTFDHAIRRTVTEADNTLFCAITMNTQPLHIDHAFARGSEWGQPLVNSYLTLALMVGLTVQDLTAGSLVANLGMSEVKFPAPLFHGDTVRTETEIVSRRESKSRADAGIVEFRHSAFKHDGTLVAQCLRQAMVRKRPT